MNLQKPFDRAELEAYFCIDISSGKDAGPMKWMVAAGAMLALASSPRLAQAQASPQDQKWLQQTHQTNLAEMAVGKLAERSGHAESIRMVGHTLATDHADMDIQLRKLAKQLGVKLPDSPNAQQKAVADKLEQQHGMEFDQMWAHDEADGHIQAIELTTFEVSHGSAPQVKQLAVKVLPVLKKHYQLLTHAQSEIHGGP